MTIQHANLNVDFANIIDRIATKNIVALLDAANDIVELRKMRDGGMITQTEFFNKEWDIAVEAGIRTREEMNNAYMTLPYTVDAGKWEQDGAETYKNNKYSEAFVTLEDAMAEFETVKTYPWATISMRDGDYIYEIDPVRTHRKREYGDGVTRYDFCDSDGNFKRDLT